MYLEYWGLQQFPFENAPDLKFIYRSTEHEEALVRLIYAVTRNKGAVLLTGEIGCGKTTLSRVFLQQFRNAKFDIVLMTNPSLEPVDFLKDAIQQIGLPAEPSASKLDLLNIINYRLIENSKINRAMLLVIDEAQLIPRATFEELRLLLNFQIDDRYLVTLILIGQPELRDIVRQYKQLDQRIAIRFHLNPLNQDDTEKYILFRLQEAGRMESVFTPAAFEEIYNYSGGVPRKINNLCDLSLFIGFGTKAKAIDVDIVKKVIRDSL